MALELRARAAQCAGSDREHLLWLALEWEKTADRERLAAPGPGRSRDDDKDP